MATAKKEGRPLSLAEAKRIVKKYESLKDMLYEMSRAVEIRDLTFKYTYNSASRRMIGKMYRSLLNWGHANIPDRTDIQKLKK